ncbi:MAG: hypothetical protein ACFFDI_05310 [Promethearchaeota archaeon]
MKVPETRGYLVGLNEKGEFTIPKKLMKKIVDSTGETALIIWLPHEKTLRIQSVDCQKVIKLTVWFKVITQTIFEDHLNPAVEPYKNLLLYRTGVLFPVNVDEKPSIEYYFRNGAAQEEKIKELEKIMKNLEGVAFVEVRTLERYTGD